MMKNNLRKPIAAVVALVMLLASLTLAPVAMASGTEEPAAEFLAAETLNKIGLFLGHGDDADGNPIYDLDSGINRLMGMVMFVRLMGAEDEALSGDYYLPFVDVPDWAAGYIAYAYAIGWARGVSDTHFDSDNTMTATQYLTLVLRTLGYQDGVDYVWDAAWDMADQVGITNGRFSAENNSFLRGDLALVSLVALNTPLSGTGKTLLESLVEGGVFDRLAEAGKIKDEAVLEAILSGDMGDVIEAIDGLIADAVEAIAGGGAPQPEQPAGGGGTGTGTGSGTGGGGGSYTNPFAQAKSTALSAITDANLPTAASLAGKTIVIPGQEVITWPTDNNTALGTPAVTDPDMLPYTDWPSVGVPAITSPYGNTAATGIFALVDTMLSFAAAGYDINTDPDFADFLGFAELYKPAAIVGTPVGTKKAYIFGTLTGAQNTGNTPLTQADDPDSDFADAYPATSPDYRIYQKVIEVGAGQIDLRVLDSIPVTNFSGFGPVAFEVLGTHVYEFGINHEGIAVSFLQLPTEAVAAYEASSGTVRIGYYPNNRYDVVPGAKYFVVATGANASVTASGDLATLSETDWGRSMRVVFNEDDEIIEAYITGTSNTTEPSTSAYNVAKQFDYYRGVRPDDSQFGYDGFENPYPVDFALYDPTKYSGDTGATDPNALYPLFIFLHVAGGGNNMNTITGGTVTNYASAAYQKQFDNETLGLSGAFVMAARSNGNWAHDLNTQGWMNGYRAKTNPHYAAGDEAAKGRTTQAAALIMNILWLIENENIDPNRIYITGHSAGGYMAWFTLLESARLGYADLFAAVMPSSGVIQPEGGNQFIFDDYSENELGMSSKILAVKDVPVWLVHSTDDFVCMWVNSIGAVYANPDHYINGKDTLWGVLGSLATPTSLIQGSPLTRVTINYNNGHNATLLNNNNEVPGSPVVEGFTLTRYSEFTGAVEPAGFNEINPGTNANTLYARGASEKYSSGSYTETVIEWFNMCGADKASSA